MHTIKGEIAEALLERKEFITDNEHEHTVVTEFRLDGELVRRDVHVTLKKAAVFADGKAAPLGD